MAQHTRAHALARRLAALTLIALLIALLAPAPPMRAAPMAQGDPAEQCAKRVELVNSGKLSEALPLLESGFVGRQKAEFALSIELALCAFFYGAGIYQTDPPQALEAYLVALQIFKAADERMAEGVVLNNIGEIYRQQSRYNEAIDYFQRALEIRRETHDRAGEATALGNLGVTLYAQGKLHEAIIRLTEALAIIQEEREPSREGPILNSLGGAHRAIGEFDKALEYFQAALAITHETHDRAGEGSVLHNIGSVIRFSPGWVY